jgi:hypothetical protein
MQGFPFSSCQGSTLKKTGNNFALNAAAAAANAAAGRSGETIKAFSFRIRGAA